MVGGWPEAERQSVSNNTNIFWRTLDLPVRISQLHHLTKHLMSVESFVKD